MSSSARAKSCRSSRVTCPSAANWNSQKRLVDSFVCPQQNWLRDLQPERFRRPKIHHQLELRRLLDGQVSGPGALEDLVHVGCCAPVEVREACPIGHETTDLRVLPVRVHRRQTVLVRELRDADPLAREDWIEKDHERMGTLLGHHLERRIGRGAASPLHELYPHLE